MDGENKSNPGGAAVAEPAGDKGAASPTVQTGAVAPAPVSPSGASAGTSEPKTYRDEDVQRIVRERLADEQKKWEPYKQFGSPTELKARQEKLERFEKAFQAEQAPKVNEEEKALRDLLDGQGYVRKEDVDGLKAQLKEIVQARNDARTNEGLGIIAKLASDKFKTTDAEDIANLEALIANSMSKDEASMKAWNSGDMSVIGKHFEKILNAPMFKNVSAVYAAGKAKDKAEVPPSMPKGGVQAPVSQDRKMTTEERREAAYKRLIELEGQA